MKHSIWGKRAIAAFGVAALTLPALAGTATAATSVPTTDGGTLTIHKYASDNVTGGGKSGNALTGTTADAPTKATPISEVPFTATPICYKGAAIDLKTAAGWTLIAGLTDASKITGDFAKCETGAASGATKADGSLALTLPTTTLYEVEEGDAPAGKNIAVKATPFLVTMPLANSDGTTWNTDVHVYPKNTVAYAPKKEILTGAADKTKIGGVASSADQVQWQLTATTPAFPKDATKFTEISLVDTMGGDLGTAENATVDEVTYDGATLTTDDYTVTKAGQTITIALSAAKIAAAKPGKTITAKITTKLVATTGGEVTNTFKFHTKTDKTGDEGTNTPVPTDNEPKIERGTFEIFKHDGNNAAIDGATFKVCKVTSGDSCNSDFVKEAGATEDKVFTSANGGKVSGTLLIDQSKAGDTTAPATSAKFCAVEQTAPDGYILDQTPRCFDLTTGATVAKPMTWDIVNAKTKTWIPGLPKTGAAGLMLLTLGGAALAAIAVGSAIVIRRRQH